MVGVVSDFVERGRRARPRVKLGRSWYTELAGGVPPPPSIYMKAKNTYILI